MESNEHMTPVISIIMAVLGSPVMEKAAHFLNEMGVPFEMNALSHTAPRKRWSGSKNAGEGASR